MERLPVVAWVIQMHQHNGQAAFEPPFAHVQPITPEGTEHRLAHRDKSPMTWHCLEFVARDGSRLWHNGMFYQMWSTFEQVQAYAKQYFDAEREYMAKERTRLAAKRRKEKRQRQARREQRATVVTEPAIQQD
jgi:hypothetical protein